MLLDNRKLTLIKYQGTLNFIAALLFEEKEKEYYFCFMPIENPIFNITNKEEHVYDINKVPLFILDKFQASFEVKGKTFGKDKKMFSLIKIKPEEFDSMYKLLECVWE